MHSKSDRETEGIKRRYNRTALYYDWMDHMFSPALRKRVLAYAGGKVLEVGVGTGKNLMYYPPGCEVTGIDFSPAMLKKEHAAPNVAYLLLMYFNNYKY